MKTSCIEIVILIYISLLNEMHFHQTNRTNSIAFATTILRSRVWLCEKWRCSLLRIGFAQHVQEMDVENPTHEDRALAGEIMNHFEPYIWLGILIINTASAHHVDDRD